MMAMPSFEMPAGIDPLQITLLAEQIGPAGVQEVVAETLAAMPAELQLLARQIDDGLVAVYPKTAHRIKGQALTFGLRALVAHCDHLERFPNDDPAGRLAQVLTAWDQAKTWLQDAAA